MLVYSSGTTVFNQQVGNHYKITRATNKLIYIKKEELNTFMPKLVD